MHKLSLEILKKYNKNKNKNKNLIFAKSLILKRRGGRKNINFFFNLFYDIK